MKYPFQNLNATNSPYATRLKEAAARVIDSGWYLLGAETEALEKEASEIIGTKHCIATGNGLDALNIIYSHYIESGILKPGDEAVVAANTFIATLLPLTRLGLKVRLAEPDEVTFGLDLKKLAESDTSGIKAVVVTHLYGTPAWDNDAAAELRSRGIIIIEDNAQALGATFENRHTGSLGDASAVSFYPAKNIGALGDAGMICTDDDRLAETARALRSYGGTEKYKYGYRGYNSRIDEIQAAFLRIKLENMAQENRARRSAAAIYDRSIEHPEIIKPRIFTDREQVWHQYVIRSPRRDQLQRYLTENGVGTMIHYPIPPHRQECYRGYFDCDLPLTERLANEVLSIPIANVTTQQAAEIAEIINRF